MADQHSLTHPQSRVWHVEQSHPGTSMWNNAGTLKIHGALDFDLLDRAVQMFLEANESLRLRIRLVDGEPVQYVAPYRPVHIDRLDFCDTGVKGLYEWDVRQTQAPMPLVESPLYYFALAKTGPDEGCLYAKMHHIVSDGVSFVVFANEVMDAYDCLLCGETPEPRPSTSYLAYVDEERSYLESKRYAYDEAYWLGRFSDFPEATLLKPRTADYFSTKAKRKACLLPADLSAAVRSFCAERHLSVFTLLLAAFAVYLKRVLGKNDLVVGAPVSNRTFAGSSERFGMYVSTVPVRVTVDDEATFLSFAENISDEWFSVLKHQRYPYDLLVRKLHEMRGDVEQLYDISLSYQVGTFEKAKRSFSYEGRWHFSGHQASSLNVHWNDRENDGRFVLDYDYLSPLFAAREVDFIHEHLCNLVADAVEHPEKRLFELDMLSRDERDKVLVAFNDTEDGFARTDLVSLWRRRVVENQAAAAVSYQGRTWTVAEVDRASDDVARLLVSQGVEAGSVVALALPRSALYYVAMLGVLKAKAAFMPLDKALPEERVHYMLAESGARFALAGTGESVGWRGEFPPTVAVFRLDVDQRGYLDCWVGGISSDSSAEGRASHEGRGDAPALLLHQEAGGTGGGNAASLPLDQRPPSPRQAAYLIYTSGSTGTPKGVVVEHAQIAHFVMSLRRTWERTQGGRMLCAGPISFDINVMEAAIGLFAERTLVVADDHQADYPAELCELIERERVDLMMVTPGRMEMILSTQSGMHALRGFREIGLGADVLPPQLLRRIRQATSSHITNFYGPTEITIAASCCDVTESADVNIGRPMNGVHVYILDPHRNPVPISVPGELYVGGAGVARGYVARDGLTAERFVPSPFVAGERLYRTGDLGRWYPRGEIQFLGRIDQQVKIRGYRVELGEIQNRLLEIEGVRSAAVVAHEEPGGRKCLCGYVVGDRVPPVADIKARLSDTLPFYMVPAYLMEIDEIPLTASEKLDRRRLPKPQRSVDSVRAPETATERSLAQLWGRLLGLDVVGRDDHFFEIGGDSLSIVRMIAEVSDVFDVDIDLADVYREPSLAACARLVDRAEAGYRKPIKPAASRKYYPATPTQQRMLLAANEDPSSTAYNVPALFVFEGSLDEERLRSSLRKLIDRHVALRTSLHVRSGEVLQQVHRRVELPFESVACSEARLSACAEEHVRPFDVGQAPLVRLVSLRTPKSHGLLFDFHHAVCDQAGFEAVLADFAAFYNGEDLPPLTVDYKDCAVWMQGRIASGALDRQAAFWRDRMAGCSSLLALPADHARTGVRRGAVCEMRLPRERLETFHSFVHAEKATATGALMTAFGLVLSRMARQTELVVGMPASGRTQQAMQHMVGAFINTLPVRCEFADGQTVRECFEEVSRSLGEAVAHQDYPFERIVADAAVDRQRGRNPLFDAMLVFGNDDAALRLDRASASPRFVATGTSKLDVTLFVYERQAGMECRLEYDSNLFSEKRARRLLDRFAHVVETLFAHPDESIDRVSVLTPDEFDLVVNKFSDTERPYSTKPLSAWVEELADARPDDEAVVAADGRLTFSELDRRADGFACALAEAGVGPGSLVALSVHRGIDLLPVLFGIIKSGAAYLPIDPTYPTERKGYMLADSGASLVLADEASRTECEGAVPGDLRVVGIDSIKAAFRRLDAGRLRADRQRLCAEPAGHDAAYVIYTSGSTGAPKGARLMREGVANLREAMAECIGYDSSWTAVSVTTMSFDIFVADALLPLTYGCRTVLADEEDLRQPHLLAHLMERERIDFIQTTPSRMQIMIRDEAFAAAARRLAAVVLAGEKPTLPLVQACKRLMPHASIKNGYGPTEVTVYTSFQDLRASDHVSIGRPIANTRVYLLDDALQPVPLGTYAEAFIGGVGVSPGYIGRDDLNASRFLPDPFRPGSAMYRSGDVCCFDEKGELYIAGRADHQVKVRGLRIEPGEIEACLCAIDGIEEAVVVARGEDEQRKLVAYFAGGGSFEVSLLRTTLAAQLPSYMVPARYVHLEALPMTSNGKVDRAQLPDLASIDASETRASCGADRAKAVRKRLSADERRFLKTVERILHVDGITLEDNVFDLGGDSLSVIAIQARLARDGWALRTQDFYNATNLGDLFVLIRSTEAAGDEDTRREGPRQTASGERKDGPLADVELRASRNAAAAAEGLVSPASIDRVAITGATGFLGAHLVAELAREGARDIVCLVRAGDDVEAQMRLDDALSAYGFTGIAGVHAVRADVSEDLADLARRIAPVDAVFHCAAITEHVGNRADYERVNVEGTLRVLELASMLEAQFMHASTMSVAGTGGSLLDEQGYDVGQDVVFNEYVRSKHLAEGLVLDAFAQGLPGRIFRVGNLTGRASDGAFQRDVHRNAFAMRLSAFARLGSYPAGLDDHFEMTPVDACARAMVLLSTHASRRIAHLCNDQQFDLEGLAALMQACGRPVEPLNPDEFAERALACSQDDFGGLFGVVRDIVEGSGVLGTRASSRVTSEDLRMLGFVWPQIDASYFDRYFSQIEAAAGVSGRNR